MIVEVSSLAVSTVLVTGGSGFLASHCILQLLSAGHAVRTTVRHAQREADVRTMLSAGGVDAGARLSFMVADLEHDAGWREAVAGCSHVLHVASPFPAGIAQSAADIIPAARDGALRVLRAARDAGVTRVVLTSSFAAIGYGHGARAEPFTESDWTDSQTPGLTPYVKSKTVAERAAWDFMAREGGALEFAVINPVAIFGPILGPDFSSSIELLRRLLTGATPAVPRLYFGVVDVRDVADLHARAMTHPDAAGERFLAVAGDFMSLREIGMILKTRVPALAARVPTRQLPDWLVRIAAWGSAEARAVLPELGKVKNADAEKARRLLGWAPRPREECIAAAAESLERFGLLKVDGRSRKPV